MLEYHHEIYMNNYSKSISEKEFDKLHELMSEDEYFDIKELSALSDEIYRYPSRNIDIIKLLRQRQQSRLETNLS